MVYRQYLIVFQVWTFTHVAPLPLVKTRHQQRPALGTRSARSSALITANLRHHRRNMREDKRQVLVVWSRRPLVQSDSLRACAVQTALIECVYTDDMQTADLSCPFAYPDKKQSRKKQHRHQQVKCETYIIHCYSPHRPYNSLIWSLCRVVGTQPVCPLNLFHKTRKQGCSRRQ